MMAKRWQRIRTQLAGATMDQAAEKDWLTKRQVFWRFVLCGPREGRRSWRERKRVRRMLIAKFITGAG